MILLAEQNHLPLTARDQFGFHGLDPHPTLSQRERAKDLKQTTTTLMR